MHNILKSVLIFILVGTGIFACSDKPEKTPEPSKEEQILPVENTQEEVEQKMEIVPDAKEEALEQKRDFTIQPDDMALGNREASVVFVEYFSPTCPHCVVYHKMAFPELKKNYIDTGKIAYVMREFVSNKQDLDASILARCMGDIDSYNKFIKVLLEQQNSWMFKKNYREILTNIAGIGGVSPEKYAACLNSSSIMLAVVENTKLVGRNPGFLGTPSFFINGKQFTGPYTVEDLSNAIDKALTDGS